MRIKRTFTGRRGEGPVVMTTDQDIRVRRTIAQTLNIPGTKRVVIEQREGESISYERVKPMTDKEKIDLLIKEWRRAVKSAPLRVSKLDEAFRLVESEEGEEEDDDDF